MAELATGTAAWVRHYGSGYFSRDHLRCRLAEVQNLRFATYHKDYPEREAIIAALRWLLSRPGIQLTLFD